MPPFSDVSDFHICWKLSCQLLNTSSIMTPLGNHGLNLKRMWAKEVDRQNKSNIISSFKSRRGKRGLGNILERLENWEKCLKSTESLREIVEWREDWAVFLFSAISLSAGTSNGQQWDLCSGAEVSRASQLVTIGNPRRSCGQKSSSQLWQEILSQILHYRPWLTLFGLGSSS